MTELFDVAEGRKGEWMTTSDGGMFFPQDMRSEDFTLEDIANGLALDCRYGGQGRVDRYYSVAEHSVLMAKYAYNDTGRADVALATLLHDAPEGLLRDLPRAIKHTVGEGYSTLEENLWQIMLDKWDIRGVWEERSKDKSSINVQEYIKDLDRRIVPLEKATIFEGLQMPKWAFDQYKPLDGIEIECWKPEVAKKMFITWFNNYNYILQEKAA